MRKRKHRLPVHVLITGPSTVATKKLLFGKRKMIEMGASTKGLVTLNTLSKKPPAGMVTARR